MLTQALSREPTDPPVEVADWRRAGPPRSRRHGDIYFSADDGLAEARAVFLAGCDLPATWAGRKRFCIGELGLGAGLNLAAVLDAWRRTRPAAGHLHLFSVEHEPLSPGEVARALAPWPEISPIAALLTAGWPTGARGFHRVDLPTLNATLDVAVMEAGEALERWDGRADAWFLDGFSPALDPGLWRQDVLNLVAARSAPGARAATYTVAGSVRRTLIQGGFEVDRRPGHGQKRERLEARLAGPTPPERSAPSVAVIGAGIAGASLVGAFRALGAEPALFEATRPGAGASGGPAALAAPRLDAGLGPTAELFAQAARRAIRLYDAIPEAVTSRGAVQLVTGPKDETRFAAIAACDLFDPGSMEAIGADDATTRLGEPAGGALIIEGAVVVDPAKVLGAWTADFNPVSIARLERTAGGWTLIDAEGVAAATVDFVCLAAGVASEALCPGLPFSPVRGQASLAIGAQVGEALSFGGYALPTPKGVLFGATHDRGDRQTEIRNEDDFRNLGAVAKALPQLAESLSAAPLTSWAAIRASSPDYLPLAGLWSEGVFVLGALGSRGFCLAPLLAEHVAALVLGAPSPLPQTLADLVAPQRFAARAARRGRGRM